MNARNDQDLMLKTPPNLPAAVQTVRHRRLRARELSLSGHGLFVDACVQLEGGNDGG